MSAIPDVNLLRERVILFRNDLNILLEFVADILGKDYEKELLAKGRIGERKIKRETRRLRKAK